MSNSRAVVIRTNVAGALSRLKGMWFNLHSPIGIENAVKYFYSVGTGIPLVISIFEKIDEVDNKVMSSLVFRKGSASSTVLLFNFL